MGWSKIDVYKIAKKKKLRWTIKALDYANLFHGGLFRKDGREAFVHPYRVCQILMFYGVLNDRILAAALLHDVLEDVSKKAEDLLRQNFPNGIVDLVVLLTKNKIMPVEDYCRLIAHNVEAVLIKLADRLHNLRNMIKLVGQPDQDKFFSYERLREQTEETFTCILRLSHWVGVREKAFPTQHKREYFAIAIKMTVELQMTVHLAKVKLGELEV